MISLRWGWYGRSLPVRFGNRVTCLMADGTLPMAFARMRRSQNNRQVQTSQASCQRGWKALHGRLPPHLPVLSLALNCPLNVSKSSRLFGLVKVSFIQCPWKGHAHNSDMFQWDFNGINTTGVLHALLKLLSCGAPPPPPRGNRHIMTIPPPPFLGGWNCHDKGDAWRFQGVGYMCQRNTGLEQP